MRYAFSIYCCLLIFSIDLAGQTDTQNITGKVTFLSSRNVYVRFVNTEGINVNDTLYISSANRLVPVLVVNSLSSSSCLCTSISSETLPVGHLIVARKRPVEPARVKTLEEVKAETSVSVIKNEPVMQSPDTAQISAGKEKQVVKQRISGSISAASYSDFSNTKGPDLQRYRYTLAFNGYNIGGTKLSVESYISFRHTGGAWNEVKSDLFKALKIYNLALKYDFSKSFFVRLGRQINQKISSIGSFDGITIEKSVKGFSVGITGGTRPDYTDFGFDPGLLQYGAYLSYNFSKGNSYSGTSLAFMEQLNSGKTDRRFIYFQHSGSIVKNLSLYSSFELDLLKVSHGNSVPGADLTSFYTSLNYRFSHWLTISGSYDARKNPVYFETFRTTLDSLKESTLRQSYRVHSTIRLNKSVIIGLQSSWRFLKSDVRQAKNASGYITYSLPGKSNNYFSATISGSYIETEFLTGPGGEISLLNTLAGGKLQAGVGYSYQDYRMPEASQNLIQHTGKADLYWTPAKKLSLSASYEAVFESRNLYNRLYLQVIKRF